MAHHEERKDGLLVKIYILVLFLLGIALWLSFAPSNNRLSVDLELNKRIESSLLAAGVEQSDVVKQYQKEKDTAKAKWIEFNKTIKLSEGKTAESFESSLRSVARSLKLGLRKTENPDGSVTYDFFDKIGKYAVLTFVK